MATISSNKRPRHNGDGSYNTQLQFTDLPDGILALTASYLSPTESILFAIACSKHDSHGPSTTSMAITSQHNWHSLDFKDLEEIELTDDNISWILQCIDGKNKIKSLKLTNCTNIIGVGLRQLQGSVVLQDIDLSLVGIHENPTLEPEPPISVSDIVPILNSILDMEDNSLIHVQLPKKWRNERSAELTSFLERFETVLDRNRPQCSNSNCDKLCEGNDSPSITWGEGRWTGYERFYGTPSITCAQCMKSFCFSCYEGSAIDFCKDCERFYCQDCDATPFCTISECNVASCKICDSVKVCVACEEGHCSTCLPSISCQYCESIYCESCSSDDMYVCEGEGCDRANCYRSGIEENSDNGCIDGNRGSAECVRRYEEGTFCLDCKPSNVSTLIG